MHSHKSKARPIFQLNVVPLYTRTLLVHMLFYILILSIDSNTNTLEENTVVDRALSALC